ncbi:amidohydrolase family protein [Streptomyces sp. 110]|uniref:Amidohydrolase family protein n=1 Tax=Streptomyces endocoffeicus TaxID=2898945 RepID=A0ABS1Q7L7_9ACTN|nr:amidohydrolase family protein [Streptomyces endocoffeicus]MBL1120142.1 amidohydrolase family protein [Streptomyces endocoffeicus]
MTNEEEDSLLLTGAQVICDLDPLTVIHDGAVGIRKDRIDWVGRGADAVAANYSRRITTTGTILPGLVDAHVHLAFDHRQADPVTHAVSLTEPELGRLISTNALGFLRSGVTTVRDLGSPAGSVVGFAEAVRTGAAMGPTIVASDQPVTRTDGHLWAFGKQIATVRDADRAVAGLAAAGAQVIKVMITGGRMTAGTSPEAVEFQPDLLTTVVARAHKEELPVAAHTLSTDGIQAAVAGQADTLEHCTFIEPDGTPCRDERVEELAALISDAGTFVCPTLNFEYDQRFPHPLEFEHRARWVRILSEHGARVILGNDTGIPGLAPEHYWGGIEALSMSGMSNEAVLKAATVAPAAALRVTNRTGSLAPGKQADLLIVDGDPLTDLSCLQSPPVVMAQGKLFEVAKDVVGA